MIVFQIRQHLFTELFLGITNERENRDFTDSYYPAIRVIQSFWATNPHVQSQDFPAKTRVSPVKTTKLWFFLDFLAFSFQQKGGLPLS